MKKKISIILQIIIFSILISCNNKPNSEIIESDKIIQQLNRNMDIQLEGKTISDDLDFTKIDNKYIISKGLSVAEIKNSITFVDCKFEGKIIGFDISDKIGYTTYFDKNLTFINCQFMDSVNFRQITVNSLVNFSQSTFNSLATFEGAVFKNANNYFVETTFKKEAKFTKSFFYGYVSFMNSIFRNIEYFKNSVFYGDAVFSACKFNGYTDFSNINFVSDFSINYSTFSDVLYFTSSVFQKDAEFNKIETDSTAQFKDNLFYGNTKFNNSTFKNNTLFKNNYFALGNPQTNNIAKSGTFEIDSSYTFTKNIIYSKEF